MIGQPTAMVIAIAAFIGAAFAGPNTNGALRGVVDRIDMRVALLHAGVTASEVEHVMSRPTTIAKGLAGDTLSFVYANEPLWTTVTLTGDHVTAIALDILHVDNALLSGRARLVKPTMARAGVLLLLGNPKADERWMTSFIEIEQMDYAGTDEPDFSVFLADGLVVDVRPGANKPSDIERIILPSEIADGLGGAALGIGLNPKQAASLVGPPAWPPVVSTLKGQPTQYATYHERGGRRLVSLTFTGGTLTAFSIWSPNSTMSCGDTCLSH